MLFGVDIHARYQGSINLALLRDQGYSFMCTKASEGTSIPSAAGLTSAQFAVRFLTWIEQARALGLVPGLYHWLKAGHGKLQAQFFHALVQRAGGPRGMLIQLDCEDNATYADVLERAFVMYDEADRPVRMVGSLMDVSARRRAEELFSMQQAELTHMARVTTMGEIASGLAHELNQPLAAIANFAESCSQALAAGGPDAIQKTRDWIEKIAANTHRAGEIIRRLRVFTRTCLRLYRRALTDDDPRRAAATLDAWWAGLLGQAGPAWIHIPGWLRRPIVAWPGFWFWCAASWPEWRGRLRLRTRARRLLAAMEHKNVRQPG